MAVTRQRCAANAVAEWSVQSGVDRADPCAEVDRYAPVRAGARSAGPRAPHARLPARGVLVVEADDARQSSNRRAALPQNTSSTCRSVSRSAQQAHFTERRCSRTMETGLIVMCFSSQTGASS